MLVLEKLSLRALEAMLLNARDAVSDQSLLAANGCWLLEISVQKSSEDFFMGVQITLVPKRRSLVRLCQSILMSSRPKRVRSMKTFVKLSSKD